MYFLTVFTKLYFEIFYAYIYTGTNIYILGYEYMCLECMLKVC